MIKDSEPIREIRRYLSIDEIQDDTFNGVQIEGTGPMERAAFAVDARRDTIDRAAKMDVDILFVHHGLIWGGIGSIRGRNYELVKRLLENDMALFTSHLPLDVHPEIGNNVSLAEMLGAEPKDTFMEYDGTEVALLAELDEGKKVKEIAHQLSRELSVEPFVHLLEEEVKTIGVMTGKGGKALSEAAKKGAGLFITGEREYTAYNEAVDREMPLIFGGHYGTETLGIKKLMQWVEERHDIECSFIEGRSPI